jgi:hypothetical protein
MPVEKSGITWFDDDVFIGSEVTFPGNSSRWKLQSKIIEHENCGTEKDCIAMEYVAEARAVFVAVNLDGSFLQEAIIKIRMQYCPLLLLLPLTIDGMCR